MTENTCESSWAYLTIFNDLGMCGCGQYDERLDILKESLNAFPLYKDENVPAYLKTPLGEWFLCILDSAELIEHGSSIGGSWLLDKGERLKNALNDENIWNAFEEDTVGLCDCPKCSLEKE